MKRDIKNRKDIQILVNSFYQKLLQHKEFAYIFQEVAKIEMLDHTEVIIDFWESVLFQTGKYSGKTLEKHLELHHQYRLQEKHFQVWLQTFNKTLEELFKGPIAKAAKEKALSIASIIKMKIDHLEQMRLELNN